VTVRSKWNGLVTLGAVAGVIGFGALVLAIYGFRPTPGVSFLVLGWTALLATGYYLVRAVATFDLGVRSHFEEVTAARRDELEREKKILLKAIKEAEFDRDTGKLDSGEAAEAITRYRARAVEIMRLLDDGRDRALEERIEKELARRLAKETPYRVEGRCPACETLNDADAVFCKKCGTSMAGGAT
jgi:hypothetical protein